MNEIALAKVYFFARESLSDFRMRKSGGSDD